MEDLELLEKKAKEAKKKRKEEATRGEVKAQKERLIKREPKITLEPGESTPRFKRIEGGRVKRLELAMGEYRTTKLETCEIPKLELATIEPLKKPVEPKPLRERFSLPKLEHKSKTFERTAEREVLSPQRAEPRFATLERKKEAKEALHPEAREPPEVRVERKPRVEIELRKVEGEEILRRLEIGTAEVGELLYPDFLEMLLGRGGGVIHSGKPVCIIVPKSEQMHEDLVAILCRDAYREKMGGKPIPYYRRDIRKLKQELEPRVQREVVIVKEADKCDEDLVEVLEEFFSLDMGFLILVSKDPVELEEEIRKREKTASIVKLEPLELSSAVRERILRIVRGFWTEQRELRSFGTEFKIAIDAFDTMLIQMCKEFRKAPEELKNQWNLLWVKSRDEEEDASDLHAAMKWFVWVSKWKEHDRKIIPKLEYDIEGKAPDVSVNGENYEVETLFRAGDPMGRLTGKISNYPSDKIGFVLKNSTILRHLQNLQEFREHWQKRYKGLEIYGIDIPKRKLLPLSRFIDEFKIIRRELGLVKPVQRFEARENE